MAFYRAWVTVAVVFGSITIVAGSAMAQKRYGPGASDTEIKIGNIAPYSGPVSAAGVNGKTIAAFPMMTLTVRRKPSNRRADLSKATKSC